MTRRLFGLLIAVVVLGATTSEYYNPSDKNILPMKLRFETSYVAMDPQDDLADTPYPKGIVSAAPRGMTVIKLMLSASVRTFRFLPQMAQSFERRSHSRLAEQGLFRLERVFRI